MLCGTCHLSFHISGALSYARGAIFYTRVDISLCQFFYIWDVAYLVYKIACEIGMGKKEAKLSCGCGVYHASGIFSTIFLLECYSNPSFSL